VKALEKTNIRDSRRRIATIYTDYPISKNPQKPQKLNRKN
jgi:hypothetical protein